MVPFQFICSLLVLTMLYHVTICRANNHYQASNIRGSTKIVEAELGSANINSEKGIYDGASRAAEVGNYKGHGGRKMMVKRVLGMAEEEHFVGGCVHGEKGVLNVKCNIKNSRPRRLKAKMADFIAFNADYHVPMPHPPKHN